MAVTEKYTCFLSFDAGANYTQVYLARNPVISEEQPNDQKFWRKTCESEVTLNKFYKDETGVMTKYLAGTSFYPNETPFETLVDWIYADDKYQDEVKFRIKKTVAGVTTTHWDGYFTIMDMKLDLDNGRITFKPQPDDAYRYLLEFYDSEFDCIEETLTQYNPFFVQTSQSEYCFMLFDPDAVFPCDDINLWDNCGMIDYGKPADQHWYIEYDLDTAERYWRYTRQYVYLKPIPSLGWTWADYKWTYPSCDTMTLTSYLHHFRLMTDVIQLILNKLNTYHNAPAYTLASEFFMNSDGLVAGNYITGGKWNTLQKLLIAQKSDAKYPNATNNASIGMLSLKNIMDNLREMFDVYFMIDGSGNFRIEHERYFLWGKSVTPDVSSVDVDLTDTTKYTDILIKETSKYQLESAMKQRERWKFMDSDTAGWREQDYIQYDLPGRLGTHTHDVSLITTDLEMLMNYTEDVSDDGFFMVQCLPSMQIMSDYVSGIYKPNGGLSFQNIVKYYWTYNRYLIEGYYGAITGVKQVFQTERRKRQQGEVSFKLNVTDGFDPYKLKRTQKHDSANAISDQDGELVEAKHDLETDWIRMVVRYNNPDDGTHYILINATDKVLIGGTDKLIYDE